MIYNMCLGFKQLGHDVTLAAAEEYAPAEKEAYDFEILFFISKCKNLFQPAMLPFSPELWPYIKENEKSFDLLISSETVSFQT